ncbi:helix-turn-helix transcriptional regulator [Tistrella mobilis]|uniref:helix-turn-helix domain-containing protein n=1 Tax=Tistrella mobilis TaxID=171437 RepID=UPI0035560A15
MISLAEMKERLLQDPETQAEYDRLAPVYEIVTALIEARHAAGMTQAQVAEKMGTQQSVIARLETARRMPSLDMVTRYAAAIGSRLAVVPMRECAR